MKRGLSIMAVIVLVFLFSTNAYSETDCESTFDAAANTLHIPCFGYGGASFWLNMKLQNGVFILSEYGLNDAEEPPEEPAEEPFEQPPLDPDMAYWGVTSEACCTTGEITLSVTLKGVTRQTSLASCQATATWEGYTNIDPGNKTVSMQISSSGCQNSSRTWSPSSAFVKGKYYTFILKKNSLGYYSVELEWDAYPMVDPSGAR